MLLPRSTQETVSRILNDAMERILPLYREQGMHLQVLVYPYPERMVQHISTEGRLQIERRATQAFLKEFHESVKEVNAREELSRSIQGR